MHHQHALTLIDLESLIKVFFQWFSWSYLMCGYFVSKLACNLYNTAKKWR